MAEETLPSNVPGVDVRPAPKGKTQPPVDGQTAVKNSAGSRAAGKPVSRQQKLITHLLIGLIMSILVTAGYTFLGPGASANAASVATYPRVNVATTSIPTGTVPPTTTNPAINGSTTASDLAALQAEMAELTRQMNEMKAQGIPVPPNPASGNAVSGMTSQGQSSMDPMNSRLSEMMSTVHAMMNTMNGMSGQTGGMSSQPAGAGHNGHH